ncbi:MAG: Ig-like domain-containing protein [Dysgonamonadaceae bacterium]|jgi:hypothetical protein|nr:Ig-like domain-containing protein [Dysgonamonadaceae bacterium]
MKKSITLFLALLLLGIVKGQAETIFSENFSSTAFPPTGWEANPATGNNNRWVRQASSFMDANTYAKASFQAEDCWLTTAKITIPATGAYVLSWRSKIDAPGYYADGGSNTVWISKTAQTTPGDFTKIWQSGDYGTSFAALSLDESTSFSATQGEEIYIAFRKQGRNMHDWYITNIVVEKAPDNDLKVIGGFPYSTIYTQIPVSQNLLAAKAMNNGSASQTNVKFAATINGQDAGVSTVVASLAPGDTSAVLLIDNAPLVAGNNEIVYNVSADETEEKPTDNSLTFSIKGNPVVYAADGLVTFTQGVGDNNDPIELGQIYKITKATTLSGALVGFSNGDELDLNISLYRLTGNNTVDETPVATAAVTRTGAGLNLFALPETALQPGDYFLAVEQTGSVNMNLAYQSAGSYYKKTFDLLDAQSGAIAVRLVLKADACTQPANLSVEADYKSAVFSWDANEAIKYVVTVTKTDGTPVTYVTYTNSLSVFDLNENTDYTWQLTSFCDANDQVTVDGGAFSTKPCVGIVSYFPFVEDFETGSSACWTSNYNGVNEADRPRRILDDTGEDHILSHTGEYGWLFSSMNADNIYDNDDSFAWLISPELTPTTGNKTIEFYHRGSFQSNLQKFQVGYSTTDNNLSSFVWDTTIVINNTDGWKQFAGSFAGNVKYVAIYYCDIYTKQMYIDDISIDAPFEFVSQNIVDDDVNVSINTKFTATFTKDIAIAEPAGTVVFENSFGDPVAISIAAKENKLILTPDAALAYKTIYAVSIPAGYVVGYDSPITATFTTEELPLEYIVTPEDGATGVSLDTEIKVAFNQRVYTGTAVGQNPPTVRINGEKVTAMLNWQTTSDTLNITHPDFQFDYNTTYRVVVDKRYVQDLSDSIIWSFTTELAPLAYTVTPEDGATGVPLYTQIKVVFNQPVNAGNNPEAKIKINDVEVAGNLDSESKELIITHPDLQFAGQTEYTVTVAQEYIQELTAPITWKFTTDNVERIDQLKDESYIPYTLSKGNLAVTTKSMSEIIVTDLSGRKLATYISSGKRNIDLNYSNGIYFVTIKSDGKTETYKVLLNK